MKTMTWWTTAVWWMAVVALGSTLAAQTPSRVKLQIREENGKILATVEQAHEFESVDAALAWLEAQAKQWKGKPDLTLGVDMAPDEIDLPGLYKQLLAAVPGRGTKLEIPSYHLEKMKEVGPYFDNKKVLHFGNWLSAFYVKEFGADAGQKMWEDLHRALDEYRPYLAANLILSLPNKTTPKGKRTWFADLPEAKPLPEKLLRQWMRMALDKDLGIETRRVFVDNLAKVNDRRTIEFCLHVAGLEGEPLWLRGTGIRALTRMRWADEILSGQRMVMVLVPSKDDEEGKKRHATNVAACVEWWRGAKKDWPKQVLPSGSGGR